MKGKNERHEGNAVNGIVPKKQITPTDIEPSLKKEKKPQQILQIGETENPKKKKPPEGEKEKGGKKNIASNLTLYV